VHDLEPCAESRHGAAPQPLELVELVLREHVRTHALVPHPGPAEMHEGLVDERRVRSLGEATAPREEHALANEGHPCGSAFGTRWLRVKRLILHARAAADIEQLDVAAAEREAPVDAP
jgi:hypothetical protein